MLAFDNRIESQPRHWLSYAHQKISPDWTGKYLAQVFSTKEIDQEIFRQIHDKSILFRFIWATRCHHMTNLQAFWQCFPESISPNKRTLNWILQSESFKDERHESGKHKVFAKRLSQSNLRIKLVNSEWSPNSKLDSIIFQTSATSNSYTLSTPNPPADYHIWRNSCDLHYLW